MVKKQNNLHQGAPGRLSSTPWTLLRLFTRTVFLALVLNAMLFSAEEEEKRKVVYLNIEGEGNDLTENPFFTGLTIEEAMEAPSIEFDVDEGPPPRTDIDFESNIREFLIQLKRENTVNMEKWILNE